MLPRIVADDHGGLYQIIIGRSTATPLRAPLTTGSCATLTRREPPGLRGTGVRSRCFLFVILITIGSTPAVGAQSSARSGVFGHYQQLTWTQRDGMPHNAVLALGTTRDGYLWVCTYEGLARFDGVRFTLFNPSTTMCLFEDRRGTLWIGTDGGGVSAFRDGHFTTCRASLAVIHDTRVSWLK